MKKILFYSLISLFVFAFSSCSNEESELLSNSTEEIQDVDFVKLCVSIDSIGNQYTPETRGINVNKWGGRVFSAVVDGITGYIAGSAGWAVGPLCLWAFDEHWERCTRAAIVQQPSGLRNSPTYVFDDGTLTKSDSIGYFHNKILDDLANSGKSYINSNGEDFYAEILSDCIASAKKYGVDIKLSHNDKAKYLAFCKDAVNTFVNCAQEKMTIDDAFENMNTSYLEKFNDAKNLDKVELIQNKLVTVLSNIEESSLVKDYADRVNMAFKVSDIDEGLKQDLKTVTSITVNSKLYWTCPNK